VAVSRSSPSLADIDGTLGGGGESDSQRLRRLADVAPSRTLYAMCVLGVADHLRDRPRSSAQLAALVGAGAKPLERVLRAAAHLDVVERAANGCWALRPAGRLLCSDEPDSLRAEFADNDLFTAWTAFEHTVRTGEPSYPVVFGTAIFERLQRERSSREGFHRHMHTRARSLYSPLVALDVWPPMGTVVDVGGGTGGLLADLLESRPGLSGVLYDLPEVVALSPLPATDVGERLTVLGGDVFAAVPAGGDLYVLASILHDWDDEQAAAILRRCRAAMKPGADLFLLERVLPDSGSGPAAFSDLWMMAMTGGQERTEGDWRRVLARAGFGLSALHSVDTSEISLLACGRNPGGG